MIVVEWLPSVCRVSLPSVIRVIIRACHPHPMPPHLISTLCINATRGRRLRVVLRVVLRWRARRLWGARAYRSVSCAVSCAPPAAPPPTLDAWQKEGKGSSRACGYDDSAVLLEQPPPLAFRYPPPLPHPHQTLHHLSDAVVAKLVEVLGSKRSPDAESLPQQAMRAQQHGVLVVHPRHLQLLPYPH
jgi:hypothetical protein